MRGWLAWIAFAACGDNTIDAPTTPVTPDSAESLPDAAPFVDDPPLACTPFGTPAPVLGLDTAMQLATTGDDLELWGGVVPPGIYQTVKVARRPDRASAFGAFESPASNMPLGGDRETRSPTLSRDGRELMLLSSHGFVPWYGVYRFTRPATNEPFSDASPSLDPALMQFRAGPGLELSANGAYLFVTKDPEFQLHALRRADRQSLFGDPQLVTEFVVRNFAVSSDLLELVYERDNELLHARRQTREELWPEGTVLTTGTFPELTPDGTTLYFSDQGRIWSMTRTCEPI